MIEMGLDEDGACRNDMVVREWVSILTDENWTPDYRTRKRTW